MRPQKRTYNYLDLNHTTPFVPDGQFISVWRNKYWRVVDQNKILFFGNSPLCNSSLAVMERLREGAPEFEWEVQQFEIVWARAILTESFNDMGEFSGIDWYYPDLKGYVWE
jgi:hypothetical protein